MKPLRVNIGLILVIGLFMGCSSQFKTMELDEELSKLGFVTLKAQEDFHHYYALMPNRVAETLERGESNPEVRNLSVRNALSLLNDQKAIFERDLDAPSAKMNLTKAQKNQRCWNNASFYSVIIVGGIGTLSSNQEWGDEGAAATFLATLVASMIEKASNNPERSATISDCGTILSSRSDIVDSYDFKWRLRFKSFEDAGYITTEVVKEWEAHTDEVRKSISGLITKCKM